jgi:uncharacterized protein
MKNYKSIYNHIIGRLRNELPSYFTYHDYKHTLHVLSIATHLANKLNISEHETYLLKIACLYHDTGFLINRIEHEQLSCGILRADLANYSFKEEDILKMEGMILATKIQAQPNNLLEMIIADADLEYLGTKLFVPIGEKLKIELLHFNPSMTDGQWYELQLKFLKSHRYFTSWCKRYREPKKQQNLSLVSSML